MPSKSVPSAHILVVDDEPEIRNLIKEILEDEGYEVTLAESGEAARQARRERRPDLILLDIWMEDIDGISLLREWQQAGGLPCPVIVMSGHGTIETAVEATRLGAYDFIEKPISLAKLLITVERALQAARLASENRELRGLSDIAPEPIGHSQVMSTLREQARRVAQHDTHVLITGEPGAGKRTLAHYIHSLSPRAQGKFVEVPIGSLQQSGSLKELFGSEEDGELHYGRLEEANGGTLYLDDIAEMDEQTQQRLLSVLETRTFTRIGGTSPVHVDLRIIAATRHDLERDFVPERFREDLFYHLNVVPLHVPRLAEHIEDVPELLNYYVDYFVTRENLPYRHFSVAAQNRLRNYDWPGNVRELKNLVQRLLILGTTDEITLEEVEASLSTTPAASGGGAPPLGEIPSDLPLREAREQFERAYLQHQLRAVGGSVGRLAKKVGMERTHLYRKLKALGIDVRKGAESG